MWLVWIQWIPLGRVLIAVLGVEKLRMPLVKVITQVVICDVCEVEEFQQLVGLLLDEIVVDTLFLGNRVLRTGIV